MMEKDGKSTATPRLRFPEFQEGKQWQTYLLEELEGLGWVELGRGDVISNQDINAIPGNYPIYSSSVKNNGYMGSYGRFMFDEELISWSVDGGGDFFHRPKHKFSVTNVSGYMRLDTSRLNYRFTASHLQSLHAAHTFDYQLKAHPSVIRKLYRLSIPNPAEQQKIADCLTSLDEIITAQRRKVEALKAHKRCLKQQLFPREGEILPRRRFSEFAKKGSWHTQKISTLLRKAAVPVVVSPEEMYREIGIRSHGKGVFHKEPVHGKVIGTKRVFRVVDKAFTVNIVFAWEQAVATISKAEEGMIASHRFPMYVAKSGKCDVKYVKEFFLTKRGKHLLGLASPGGAGRNKTLGQKEFEKLEIAMPDIVDEQTRIADCISSVDAQIVAESEKLDALKAHKKGLMQQLFPAAGD